MLSANLQDNTTAFSWSPDIIDVANAHTIGENFTPSFIPLHTRINRGDIIRLDGGNVIEQGSPEEIFVFPTQERTRQFSAVIYRNLLIIFKMI